MRILVVEDNLRFGGLLQSHLKSVGYTADIATSIAEFKSLMVPNTYDLLIVDLSLPDGDGIEVIRMSRNLNFRAPILIVSGRTAVQDRIAGLDCGADDFLIKPFNVAELLARIRALMRRPGQLRATKIRVGRIALELASGEVTLDDATALLSPTERQLLALLVRRRGSVVSKEAIDGQIHGREVACTPNAVEQLVSRLRKTLAKAQAGVDVKTVRGVGYLLEKV